jgi:imidazoleglycerol-phosphate dehydratase
VLLTSPRTRGTFDWLTFNFKKEKLFQLNAYLTSILSPCQPEREGRIERKTNETSIEIFVDLKGKGDKISVDTGIGTSTGACYLYSEGFLDHMLTALAKHGNFNLALKCTGDLHIDDHHTAEDCAIALGQAFDMALGDRKGILR